MKTVLCLCGRYRKTAAIRITRNEGKRNWSETKRGGMARKRAVPSFSFSRRAHLLTTSEMHSIFGGGGIPPDGRAVRSARRTRGHFVLCGERRTIWARRLSSAQRCHFCHCETSPQAGRGNPCFPVGITGAEMALCFAKSVTGRLGKGERLATAPYGATQ